MKATEIIKILEKRHVNDLFVAECKTGPTWTSNEGTPRLDAWTMKKSWTNPRYIGYEVKVSRSDFVRDHKWTGYLKFCTEFYFVCPSNLIPVKEVPDGVGLLWVDENGGVRIKKVAKKNLNTEIDTNVFKYILMSRTKIIPPSSAKGNGEQSLAWGRWLENVKSEYFIGQAVACKIGEAVGLERKRVLRELKNTENSIDNKNELLQSYIHRLEQLGVKQLDEDINNFKNQIAIRHRIEQFEDMVAKSIGKDLHSYLDQTIASLNNSINTINVIKSCVQIDREPDLKQNNAKVG